DDIGLLRREFEILHNRRFGFFAENKALVVDAVEVETVGGGAGQAETAVDAAANGEPDAVRHNRFYSQGSAHEAAVVLRDAMQP
ncbi:hypothetical protein, partial [Salmonella enterica]|uniref:hypothetical protein n=1 Tax=Salmonella enterica TaxID=28901 RepID=UPI0021B19E59